MTISILDKETDMEKIKISTEQIMTIVEESDFNGEIQKITVLNSNHNWDHNPFRTVAQPAWAEHKL